MPPPFVQVRIVVCSIITHDYIDVSYVALLSLIETRLNYASYINIHKTFTLSIKHQLSFRTNIRSIQHSAPPAYIPSARLSSPTSTRGIIDGNK